MSTPAEVVEEAFAQAHAYANEHKTQLTSYLTALNGSLAVAPTVDVVWAPIAAPTALDAPEYVPPTEYASDLSDALHDGLLERLAGGTGLDAATETAIWDRARDREAATWTADISAAGDEAEAMGFALPAGVSAERVRMATRNYLDKVSAASREIAVKQAELEQSNMIKVFDQGNQYEQAMAEVVAKRSQVALDGFRADLMRFEGQVKHDLGFWEVSIKQYEAQRNYVLTSEKLNSEITRFNANAALDSAKVGAQVYGQLVASSYSLIHANASVSASAGNNVSYSYSNDTVGAAPTVTAV